MTVILLKGYKMGNWEIKAFVENNPNVGLKELIAFYVTEGFLPKDDTRIEYLYDTTAIGITEIYFEYKDKGKFTVNGEPLNILSFTAGRNEIHFLQTYVSDIINEKPDEDGEREYAVLFKEAPGWKEYMINISDRLNMEYQKLPD